MMRDEKKITEEKLVLGTELLNRIHLTSADVVYDVLFSHTVSATTEIV